MNRVLAVASGKGGAGATTLIDANLTTPTIGLHLGSPVVNIGLQDALSHPERAATALYHHRPTMLRVVPGSVSLTNTSRKHHALLKLPAVLTEAQALAIKHPVTYSHPDAPASRLISQLAQTILR